MNILSTLSYLSDPETLDNPAVYQVLIDNLIEVRAIDIGIPDSVRIDDDDRTFLTPVQASRHVDTHAPTSRDSELLAALLRVITHAPGIKPLAAVTAVVALVGTKKHVIAIIGHGQTISGTVSAVKIRNRTPLR
jgi:hypothetical protein